MSFGSLPIIKGLYICMQHQPKLISDVAHSLKFLLKRSTLELCEQMISTGIIQHLLKILDDQLTGNYIF